MSWKFHCYVTCLEALSTHRRRPIHFQQALDVLKEGIEKAAIANKDLHGIETALESAQSALDGRKMQSSGDAIAELLKAHSDELRAELPGDHPAQTKDMEFFAKQIYKLRSKVAHNGSWGNLIDEEKHRAYQFASVAAKVIMRSVLS